MKLYSFIDSRGIQKAVIGRDFGSTQGENDQKHQKRKKQLFFMFTTHLFGVVHFNANPSKYIGNSGE